MESPNISKLDKFCTNFRERVAGFTLIEITVVMGLLVIIGSLLAFSNFDVWRGNSFRGECDLLISVLQKARSQSINNICLGSGCTEGQPHGVAIRPSDNPDKYIIFQGESYTSRDASLDEIFKASDSVNIYGSTISEVVFSQLSGTSTEGEIILNETNGFRSETISINNEGRIDF